MHLCFTSNPNRIFPLALCMVIYYARELKFLHSIIFLFLFFVAGYVVRIHLYFFFVFRAYSELQIESEKIKSLIFDDLYD